SAPTVGFLSSWASSAETNAGCVRNWPIQQTAASARDSRRIKLHRPFPNDPAANFARRMLASWEISLWLAALRPKMGCGISACQFAPHRSRSADIFELIECRCGVIETGCSKLRLLTAVNRRNREQRQQPATANVFVRRSHVGQAQYEQRRWSAKRQQIIALRPQVLDRGPW